MMLAAFTLFSKLLALPDRLAGLPGSSITFDASRGLVLGTGASAFLTDVTFANFELQVDVTAAAPTIVIRPEHGAELEVGGLSCAFALQRDGHEVEVVEAAAIGGGASAGNAGWVTPTLGTPLAAPGLAGSPTAIGLARTPGSMTGCSS